MRFKHSVIVISLMFIMLACSVVNQLPSPTKPLASPTINLTPTVNPVLVSEYDPARNPTKDVENAVALARSENKRIMLEIGGDWCIWCHIMDTFFETHIELLALRNANYIFVKVNFSSKNENEAFFTEYPKIPGYPHIFILDSDGKLLHSQNTGELEEGKSYNPDKFDAFLQTWSKP